MNGIRLVTQTSAGWVWATIILLYVLPIISILMGIFIAVLLTDVPFAGRLVPVIISMLVAGMFAGIFVWANWPLNMQYHRYVPTTITVGRIANRFIASDTTGGGSTQRFVLESSDGMPYACDDTRCALVTKGEVITLMCVRQFEQNGVAGYACNWGEVGKNG